MTDKAKVTVSLSVTEIDNKFKFNVRLELSTGSVFNNSDDMSYDSEALAVEAGKKLRDEVVDQYSIVDVEVV